MEDPRPGAYVGRKLRLVRSLRRGGMGSVWLAHHEKLGAEVVVKFLSRALAFEPSSLQRFTREATAAAQVRSPYVVQILDHGVDKGGLPYIVMEYLEGHDLADELRRGAMDPAKLAVVVEHVARALTKVHARGIMHRDIKPSNIFLCDVGGGEPMAKLVDFGIAKVRADEQPVTNTGEIVGTPMYMSPEQIDGLGVVDERSDLWSLGVVAYQGLTGEPPFRGETIAAIAMSVLQAPIPVPSQVRPGLPVAVDAWFARACARKAEERFASARELADSLWLALGVAPRSSGALPPISTRDVSPPSGAHRPSSLGASVTAGVDTKPPRRVGVLVGGAAMASAVLAAGLVTLIFALRHADSPPRSAGSAPPSAPMAPPSASAPESIAQTAPAAVASSSAPSVPPATPATRTRPSGKPRAGGKTPKEDDDVGF